jgi:hypothetical protein
MVGDERIDLHAHRFEMRRAGAVAAVGAGEYSLSNDPRFAEAFSDEGDDDDDEGGVGTGVALAGAFVLFEVLVDFLSDS